MSIAPTTHRLAPHEKQLDPAVYAPSQAEQDAIGLAAGGVEMGSMRLPWQSILVDAADDEGWHLIEDVAANWIACPYSDQGPLRIWPGRERPKTNFATSLGGYGRPLELKEGDCIPLQGVARVWWIWSPARWSNETLNSDRALVIAGTGDHPCMHQPLDWDTGRLVRTGRTLALADAELPIRLRDARSRELWIQNPRGSGTAAAIGPTGGVDADSGSEDGFQLGAGENMVIGPKLGAMEAWFATRSTAASVHPLTVLDYRRIAPWENTPTG